MEARSKLATDDVVWGWLIGPEHGFEPRVPDAIAFGKVPRVFLPKPEPSRIEFDLSLTTCLTSGRWSSVRSSDQCAGSCFALLRQKTSWS